MIDVLNNLEGTETIFLVEERLNPSSDYYLVPALKASSVQIKRCGFRELPSADELAGSIVIFVRYVPLMWKQLVEKERSRIKALALFIDDDVLDFSSTSGLPLRYRNKLLRLSVRRKKWLRQMKAELWVSTIYLQEKYSAWSPSLVLPRPYSAVSEPRLFFYHGSAAHRAEIKWLRPVVEEVLHQEESAFFEIIGNADVFRLYRDLPRVKVIRPMTWPVYQQFMARPGRHVGLAPQLDSLFNRARSYTKLFDITCCGAAGIYSPGTECARVVDDGIDGLIVSAEPAAWAKAILSLLKNDQKRQQLYANAQQKLLKLSDWNYHRHQL